MKCIFCEIVNEREPAYIVYKDDIVTAFLDINPVSKGHVLVIPNKHIEQLNNISENNISNALMNVLIMISKRMVETGMCADFSILQANGYHAEQEINHIHFHIIPRYENDNILFKLDTNINASRSSSLMDVLNTLKLPFI